MLKISSFILISVFFIFGCASIKEMNINLDSLKGMKIDRAISILGIGNPTSAIELENRRIYVWESSGNLDIPMGGYNYGHDQYGNAVSTWDPNQSSNQIPLKCKITIYTSKDYRILDSLVEGDSIQCNAYDEKLKRAANYIQKQKDNYKDGERDGPYEMYYDNGQFKQKSNYKDGERDGPWEMYYDNGQLKQKSNYKDGERDGPWEMYYDNGQLKSKGNYKDGELDGPWESYYENGQLKSKGNSFTDLKNNKENNLEELSNSDSSRKKKKEPEEITEEQSEILSQLLEMYEKGLISKTVYELEKKKTLNKN